MATEHIRAFTATGMRVTHEPGAALRQRQGVEHRLHGGPQRDGGVDLGRVQRCFELRVRQNLRPSARAHTGVRRAACTKPWASMVRSSVPLALT